MRESLAAGDEIYTVYNQDENAYPFIISIPHSGEGIPADMEEKLADNLILPNMDWYLPELYLFLQDMGFTVIVNHVSRYAVDLNRDLVNHCAGAIYLLQ